MPTSRAPETPKWDVPEGTTDGRTVTWTNGVLPVTFFVSDDEPCLKLREVSRQAPGSRGWRRAQILTVIRHDRPAEYAQDLGPRWRFPHAQEFQLPGGVVDERTRRITIVHTVGELRDIAQKLRAGDIKPPEMEPTDLVGGYHDHLEQKRLRARKRSAFGRYQRTERN